MKTAVSLRFLAGVTLLTLAAAPGSRAQSGATVQYYSGLTYTGVVGSARTVEAVDSLVSGNQAWVTLTNFDLPSSPFLYFDLTSVGTSKRFYRAQADGVSLRTYPGLTVTGVVGSTNLVQYDVNGTWTTLDTLMLDTSPTVWMDSNAPVNERRTYRAVDIGFPPIITSAGSQRAQAGYPMSYQIAALSVPPVTSYGAVGLPMGLAINSSSGLISGTPGSVGTNTVTITATSENGTGTGTVMLRIRTAVRPAMVAVPASTFKMGSDAGEAGRGLDEGPTTLVTLTEGFSISVYEITQAEYRDVVGSNPSAFIGDFSRPVDQVNYSEAINYCVFLTARDRALGAISLTQAYRLPTEAEWECAVRAATTNRFSFGNTDSDLAAYGWYSANGGGATHPVGDKAPNALGLYDAHGNCWEWCSDYYGDYAGGSVSNPQGPGSGSTRVIRGGSWFQDAHGCRSANRDAVNPSMRSPDIGFRVVLVPVP